MLASGLLYVGVEPQRALPARDWDSRQGRAYVEEMSVPVGPDSIEQHILGRPFAYVISTSTTGAHVIAVQVELWEGHLDCSRVGQSTRRNVVDNPSVTVVFPPARDYGDDDFGGYSLLVDGDASYRDDRLVVEIRSAVLHRPA